jgi:hypothetical protein
LSKVGLQIRVEMSNRGKHGGKEIEVGGGTECAKIAQRRVGYWYLGMF